MSNDKASHRPMPGAQKPQQDWSQKGQQHGQQHPQKPQGGHQPNFGGGVPGKPNQGPGKK
ncbi:MAG TPA: hypothetical protein VF930_07650 [Stellaceae bacterium]